MKTFTRITLMVLLLSAQFAAVAAALTAGKLGALPHQLQTSSPASASNTVSSLGSRTLTPTLSLYPNPARGMVMISVSQHLGQPYKLRLSNIIGREVRTITVLPEVSNNAMAVNLSDLPAGMYFYSLLLNDKVLTTKRLVLQN
ncbi:T9SS type A sorting domain-containing protein [Hymenobacter jejuensis]|nr:T9SS type A sorting domain-containing protein [Hymenobacter jejuensis]